MLLVLNVMKNCSFSTRASDCAMYLATTGIWRSAVDAWTCFLVWKFGPTFSHFEWLCKVLIHGAVSKISYSYFLLVHDRNQYVWITGAGAGEDRQAADVGGMLGGAVRPEPLPLLRGAAIDCGWEYGWKGSLEIWLVGLLEGLLAGLMAQWLTRRCFGAQESIRVRIPRKDAKVPRPWWEFGNCFRITKQCFVS